MKKIVLIISLIFASYIVDAQVINLIKDNSYAVNNDWKTIFDNFKKLTVFDDGTAMISHKNENRYSLFDKNGKLVKDIKIYFEDSKKNTFNLQPVFGKIGELYFTGNNSQGYIYLFNNNGLIVKELKIDYSAIDMLALDDSHIAIYGSTSWQTKQRYFISIVDINTGKDKIIYDYFRSDFRATNDEDYIIYANVYVKDMPEMAKMSDKLIVALSDVGKIRIYTSSGDFIEEKQLDWQPKTLSVEEQKVIQTNAINKYREQLEAFQKKTKFKSEDGTIYENYDNKELVQRVQELLNMIENGMEHITKPITIGWFTASKKGLGDNVIFFEDATESGENKFRTYSVEQGRTLSQNSFQCADYNLAITKNHFVINNGYVYGVQELKDLKGEMRLVRFKL